MGNGVLATDFVGAGNNAVVTAGLSGAVDSIKGSTSLWFNMPAGGSGSHFFYSRIHNSIPADLDGISFEYNTNSISILMKNVFGGGPGGPDIMVFYFSTSGITLGVWHHLLASWDHTTPFGAIKSNLYIDDVDSFILGPFNKRALLINHTTLDHAIAGTPTNIAELDGCMSEFYFSTEFIDFSLLANRRLFIDGTGLPVELGPTGALPTGTAPIIYLPDGDPTANAGTGGNFVQNGTVAACPTVPNVTPLTPRDIIEAVRDEVRALKALEPDNQIRSRLSFADDNLTDALSKFDAGDIRKTAKGVRKAVRFLEKAVEKDFSQAQVTDWSERLCSAVRTIADDEITAAIGRTGDPVKIAEAQDAFADGELEKLFDEFLEAIRDYEKAIKSAVVA